MKYLLSILRLLEFMNAFRMLKKSKKCLLFRVEPMLKFLFLITIFLPKSGYSVQDVDGAKVLGDTEQLYSIRIAVHMKINHLLETVIFSSGTIIDLADRGQAPRKMILTAGHVVMPAEKTSLLGIYVLGNRNYDNRSVETEIRTNYRSQTPRYTLAYPINDAALPNLPAYTKRKKILDTQ